MPTSEPVELPWPAESATTGLTERRTTVPTKLTASGSNIVLDLHGDPNRARAVVFSDGNHHMALEETLTKFLEANPDAVDIFYATTPPRILIDALKSGSFKIGNLVLTVAPHVFIGPDNVLDVLSKAKLVGRSQPFMRSNGLSILVKKDNPAGVQSPVDLLSEHVRLAISNPVTETASFNVYAAALVNCARIAGLSEQAVQDYLRSPGVMKSQVIHHREIPQLIASGVADVSLIYHHLALRYTRIFPDVFDLVPIPLSDFNNPERFCTNYHLALVGDGGPHGSALIDHLLSDQTATIYEDHGLARP